MKVYVTGIGINAAIGTNVSQCTQALLKQHSGLAVGNHFNHDALALGRVKMTDSELRQQLNLSGDHWPRTALLGLLAATEAFQFEADTKGIKKGFINGTTTGGMDRTEQCFLSKEENNQDWSAIETHDLGVVTELIAQELGDWDYVNTLSTACSSAANSILLGARMLRSGDLDQVLAGGCDALTFFTINGFKSLMIYSDEICRPFDQQRSGLNLGEGAGYLLLENEKSLAQSGNTVLAELTGWANANDAFHQTGTSEDGLGARLAMTEALKQGGLKPAEIDYLNAHGTATNNNDRSESRAIDTVYEAVDFSSTKGFTGHTLGASGGIEAVFSILSLLHQHAWANANLNEPLEEAQIRPIKENTTKKINSVMSNSFGFGGNSTSLIFTKN